MTTTTAQYTRRTKGVANCSRGPATNGSGESARETLKSGKSETLKGGNAEKLNGDGAMGFVLVDDLRGYRACMVWTSRYLSLCDAQWHEQPGSPLHQALCKRIQKAAGRRLA